MPAKEMKIYREEAKDRVTTHWDLDCMTSKQLESILLDGRKQTVGDRTTKAYIGGWLTSMLRKLTRRED